MSEDPLGFKAGVNFYAYVGNNPINLNDPTGNCPACLYYGGIGIAAGVRFAAPYVIRGAIAATNYLTNAYIRGSIAAGSGATYLGNQANQFVTRGQQTVQSVWTNPNILSVGNNPNALEFIGSVIPNTPPSSVSTIGGIAGTTIGNIDNFINTVDGVANSISNGIDSASQFIGDVNDALQQPWAGGRYPDPDFLTLSPGGTANGGFVLYPNKTNNNISTGVYQK